MRAALALPLLFAATSVGAETGYALSQAEIATVQNSIRAELRDPGSAQFSPMFAFERTDGTIAVCGLVNARNGYGGYAGDAPFIVGLTAQGAFDYQMMAGVDEYLMEELIYRLCDGSEAEATPEIDASSEPGPPAIRTTEPSAPAGMTVLANHDFPGGDIGQRGIEGVTFAECQAQCLSKSECLAVTWVESSQWCWPKSVVQSSEGASGMMSAIRN